MIKIYFLVAGLFFLNLNLSAQQELIQNGSFELGDQSWDFSLSTDGYADLGKCAADDGDNYLWFGDIDELTGKDSLNYDAVIQTVTLPSNLDFAEFSFKWSGSSDEQDSINKYDFLLFSVLDGSGNEIFRDSVSNADLNPTLTVQDCDGWYGGVFFTVDSQYAGQNITIGFASFTDDLNPTIFRVDNVSLLAQTTTGLSENKISEIKISPNPASEQLQIDNLKNSNSKISIFNTAGMEINSYKLNSGLNTINISSLPAGFYLVKEENGVVSKIVKQ